MENERKSVVIEGARTVSVVTTYSSGETYEEEFSQLWTAQAEMRWMQKCGNHAVVIDTYFRTLLFS